MEFIYKLKIQGDILHYKWQLQNKLSNCYYRH